MSSLPHLSGQQVVQVFTRFGWQSHYYGQRRT